jgi:hypothetical protein
VAKIPEVDRNGLWGVAVKKLVWLVGGMCAAAAGFLVWGSRRAQGVEELAHRLEDAWHDHNTAA